ncbi:MAG: hypothetical protein ACE5FN_05125 [Leptospirillia bacterium]
MKYPLHSALLLLFLAGMVVTAIYDDVIYPMDDGIISISLVFLFVIALGTLISRAQKDEKKRREAGRDKPAS